MTKTYCQHINLVPLEVSFARKIYPNGYKNNPEYDYDVTALGATVLHVIHYYCPKCHAVIKAPKIYKD